MHASSQIKKQIEEQNTEVESDPEELDEEEQDEESNWLEEADHDLDPPSPRIQIPAAEPIPIVYKSEAIPMVPDYRETAEGTEQKSEKQRAEERKQIKDTVAGYNTQRAALEKKSQKYNAMNEADQEAFAQELNTFAGKVNLYCNRLLRLNELNSDQQLAVGMCAAQVENLRQRNPAWNNMVLSIEEGSNVTIKPIPPKKESLFARFCCCFPSKKKSGRTDLLSETSGQSDETTARYTSFNTK